MAAPHRTPPFLRFLAYAVVSATALSAASAQAAKIKGRIEGHRSLVNPVWVEAKDPKSHTYSFREPVPSVRPEFRRLYPYIPKEVCVVALAPTAQKPLRTFPVRIGGGRTTPSMIVVPPGTKIVFQNTDPFKHKLYGVGLKTFTAAETAPGAVREWTIAEAGIFEIRDEAAPSLRLWIIGEPNAAASTHPNTKAEFVLPLEQGGEYTVQAYFAGKKLGPAVPVKVDTADVDIARTPLKLAEDKPIAPEKPEAKPETKPEGEAK